MSVTITKEDKKLIISTSVANSRYVNEIKKIGGKWTGQGWQIDARSKDLVLPLLKKYYGYSEENGAASYDLVDIKLRLKRHWRSDTPDAAGFLIAKGYGRDSGAKICDGIAQLNGKEIDTAGSTKNWYVSIEEGTEIIIYDFSRELLSEIQSEEYQDIFEIFEIVEHKKEVDKESLLKERNTLLERLKIIDEMLNVE